MQQSGEGSVDIGAFGDTNSCLSAWSGLPYHTPSQLRKEPMLDAATQVGTPLFQDFDVDTSYDDTQAPRVDDAAMQAATEYFEMSPSRCFFFFRLMCRDTSRFQCFCAVTDNMSSQKGVPKPFGQDACCGLPAHSASDRGWGRNTVRPLASDQCDTCLTSHSLCLSVPALCVSSCIQQVFSFSGLTRSC